VTVVVAGVAVPELAVTVMVYAPIVVPLAGMAAEQTFLLLPPHAATPPVMARRRAITPSLLCQRHRRAGIPKSSRHAKAAPPLAYQGILLCVEEAVQPPPAIGAVVDRLIVAVPALAPVMLTGLVTMLQVGGSIPFGPAVMAAVNVTLPVNPSEGVTVIVLVPLFPCVTFKLVGEAASVKPGIGAAFTVRAMVVDAVKVHGRPQVEIELPLIVTVTGPPVVAVPLAVSVSTLEPVAGLVPNAAVTPAGSPVVARVTAPANPPTSVNVMVSVALDP
jgi:hypothetical protein